MCYLEIPGWLQFYSTASSEYDEYLKVIIVLLLELLIVISHLKKNQSTVEKTHEKNVLYFSGIYSAIQTWTVFRQC